MEKRLVQRHREQRNKGDKRDKYHKALVSGVVLLEFWGGFFKILL